VWPIILQIGPLTIYSFGTMVAVSCMAGAWVMAQEMDRRGLDGEVAWSLAVWATFAGFAASAVWYYVQHHFWELLSHPVGTIAATVRASWEHFETAEGSLPRRILAALGGMGSGFVWYGGLIGGVAMATWIIRRHRLPWLTTVDCGGPALALAHGIGRIGCQLAGDGDWGKVTDVPWAMAYPNAIVGWPPLDDRGIPYPADVVVHPTPIYEMLSYFVIFAVLWRARKHPHRDGALLWWYLLLSAAARFVIEFWRVNPTAAFGLSVAQLFSLVLIVVAGALLIIPPGQLVDTAVVSKRRGVQPASR
jgi:phosphatidylglycerol:prolipoprotein diacylglycerol transferase